VQVQKVQTSWTCFYARCLTRLLKKL
jgi:hypothetical protein